MPASSDQLNRYYVYFIQEVKASKKAPVKIGFSDKPERRLADFQTGNPRELIIVQKLGPMTLAQARHMEIGIHRRFRQMRLRGEWFSGKVPARFVTSCSSSSRRRSRDWAD